MGYIAGLAVDPFIFLDGSRVLHRSSLVFSKSCFMSDYYAHNEVVVIKDCVFDLVRQLMWLGLRRWQMGATTS